MKYQLLLSSLAFSLSVAAAPAPQQNHVPGSLDGISQISQKAAALNHVLVVNVADAIPAKDWPLCVNYAASRIPINIATNVMSKVPDKKVKGKAVVAVYITDVKGAEPILAAPCKWCLVNVAGLQEDSPDATVLRDRYAKMILKGVAAACGSGATVEPLCSLFYGSNTLKGMDKTNITISPMAYFPMVETLRSLGGDEAVAQAFDEQ